MLWREEFQGCFRAYMLRRMSVERQSTSSRLRREADPVSLEVLHFRYFPSMQQQIISQKIDRHAETHVKIGTEVLQARQRYRLLHAYHQNSHW